jgi:hypothetical protein
METITIHKAKTQLSRLIEKACRERKLSSREDRNQWYGWWRSRIRAAIGSREL